MKWLLIFALLWIVLNVANNALKNRGASDSNMRKVTEDLNKRMPMVGDEVRVEHAEYANRRILFTGKVVEGQILNEEWNAKLRAQMVSFYCSNETLSKSKVVFAYSYDQVALRNINDKLKRETFSGEVSGADCKR